MTLVFSASDRPYLPRGVRIQRDAVRDRTVLMAPEKVIELDDIGVAILSRVDGQARFGDIIADLAATFGAPAETIEKDAQQFLQTLRGRLYVMVKP
ncbi:MULTISPECIES: pyrroloquinoline quinone biosynthesis peptide chaperone PqqD [unclassified Ruegeria]|uniref:pyrroloquinoline quinone biosynthesis peptide chaperone PqqD n=1 Tax=unclassified Ruegeria TaxID=2625375 RepID=UPI001ADB4172|nr:MULTISPECIES: pyrroloquinoline quinone biosynthesis peptide chaperone PqqD [unclassified Ruegeria]MBO9413657.1 pyrroloquinoline quinone biosynthesis peptide chaperone PqqD [Ruegeria sp. R8_1]MBO9417643.1 pyrroloquinoline quinone biosynthesis peptide chaperone PqqD [Ruegeria sp. R8_2]